jgi:iron complex outermembrane recepter protein
MVAENLYYLVYEGNRNRLMVMLVTVATAGFGVRVMNNGRSLIWLMSGMLPLLVLVSPAGAQSPPAQPSPDSAIPRLNDLEPSATTVTNWVAQIEAAVVQITGVRVENTEAGLQVVLETDATLAMPETGVVGNALIVDVANAAIAEEFSQSEPIAGIALVSVTGLPGNRVRIAITGTDSPPVAGVTSEAQGLVVAVRLGDAVAGAEEEEIELVVTGEQDEGYNPSNTSVGTRMDTPLRDIPQSINIVPQEVLRDQSATNLTEALRNVPGVAQSSGSRELGSNTFIRGFELFGNGIGNDFLRNGLRETSDGISELTPNIERIEVLKGPASVLYGQGAPGGTINFVTKQPLDYPFYQVEAGVGSYDSYRGAIDLSGPLNDSGTVLYRLNAAYLDEGSFVDFYDLRQFTIAPVVSVALGESTRITLEGEYTDRSQAGSSYLPVIGTVLPNPNGVIPRNRNVDEPDSRQDFTAVRVGYKLEHQFSDDWSIQQTFQFRRLNRDDIGAYGIGLDADNRTLNRTADAFSYERDFYNLNVNLTGRFATGSIGHQLIFGVDLGRYEDIYILSSGTAAPIDLFNPVYGQPFGELVPVQRARLPQDTLGIYLQDQVTLSPKLKLLLGGRFDLATSTIRDFLADTETIETSNAFTPRLGIVYQPIEPISLYASYSRSFNPSGGASFEGDLFQPERGTQYEVGIKADVNDRLTATLSLYELTRSNVLTSDTRPGVPPGQFEIQTGEQRSRGVELSVAGEILPGWNITAGYAYTDARITEDNSLPVGARLSSIPENTFNLWTSYEFQRGSLQGLGLGLGFFFVGERPIGNPSEFELPSYLRTDAAIYYQRDQFRAALNFKNLFDAKYFENSFAQSSVNYGDPFTVEATVSWEF